MVFEQPLERINTMQQKVSPAKELFRACIARFLVRDPEHGKRKQVGF
jgi:hypothetical protein